MSRPFDEARVRALFLLAGIEVKKIYQIENPYWPDAYVEERKRSPWFLVHTPDGMMKIGWRKRVLSINWNDTSIRMLVTADSTTKDLDHVHAWTYAKAVEYLEVLASMTSRSPA